jgi:inosine-uridine nucleoside N-ribohydrolase
VSGIKKPMINDTSCAKLVLLFFCMVALISCLQEQDIDFEPGSLIILDTDFSSDADDAGAVAVLHNLARDEEKKILGIMISSGDPWSAPSLALLNEAYDNPVPIGVVRETNVVFDSLYTRAIGEGFAGEGQFEDAPSLYRSLLSSVPDQSVTIVSIGFLTNLAQLLHLPADSVSGSNGFDLIKKKVKLLVCMGGEFPSGTEWNFAQDPMSARSVVRMWPSPIIFAGFELGEKVVSGNALIQLGDEHPLRLIYQLHNRLEGRPSWDQLAVFYAMLDSEKRYEYFRVSEPGKVSVGSDGYNHWKPAPRGNHAYLRLAIDSPSMSKLVDKAMIGEFSK